MIISDLFVRGNTYHHNKRPELRPSNYLINSFSANLPQAGTSPLRGSIFLPYKKRFQVCDVEKFATHNLKVPFLHSPFPCERAPVKSGRGGERSLPGRTCLTQASFSAVFSTHPLQGLGAVLCGV